MSTRRIYLDFAATYPLRSEAKRAMLPWLEGGNPSSLHADGRRVRAALDQARERLSAAMGCEFGECIFTSGATEAANLALIGSALANQNPARNRIVLSAGEHHCVLHTEAMLRRLGYNVEMVQLDAEGRVDLDDLQTRLSDDVLIVSAMHANNETGAISDVVAVSELAHRVGAIYFCDAVQTFGKVAKLAQVVPADLIAISAHKVGGPVGVGALMVRAGTQIKPLIVGGGQERELRGGTENVPGIVGFGAVAAAPSYSASVKAVRDQFRAKVIANGAQVTISGDDWQLGGHCHLRYPGISAETMLIRLDRAGVSASSGAACSSGSVEPSHVLLACGWLESMAKEGLRFSFGPGITASDAISAAMRVAEAAEAIRMSQSK